MTKQIGIKLEPALLKQIQKYAKENGLNVSALMRQATIEYIKRNNAAYTPCQPKGALS